MQISFNTWLKQCNLALIIFEVNGKKLGHPITKKVPFFAMILLLIFSLVLPTIFVLLLKRTGLLASNENYADHIGPLIGELY